MPKRSAESAQEKEMDTTATAATESTNGKIELKLADSVKHTLTLNLPDQLRDKIKADAATRDVPDNTIAREILASHYGMVILDNAPRRTVLAPTLTKEQRSEVRKLQSTQKRETTNALMDAILSGTMPRDVLEKYGLAHLLPKTTEELVAEVVAKANAQATGVPAEVAATATA